MPAFWPVWTTFMRTCGGKNENIVINVLTWLFAYQTRAFCERWAWDKLPDSNSRQVGLCLTILGPVYTAGKSLRRDGSRIHCGWNAHDKFRVEYVSLNTGIKTHTEYITDCIHVRLNAVQISYNSTPAPTGCKTSPVSVFHWNTVLTTARANYYNYV